MTRTLVLAGALVALVGCVPRDRASLPPDATPRQVLEAYAAALVAGDCGTARTFTTSTFVKGNGELCGDVRVSHVSIDPRPPAAPSDAEVVFATTITTGGSSDGSLPAGDATWFYDLRRQPDGSWRITGGGSGP